MKRKHGTFFGITVLLVAVMFTLAGCDNSTGGGGGGGLTWDDWEANAVDQGHTAGWPTSQISTYGITLSSPGGSPYYWDEAGDLAIQIGRANQTMFNTLKATIDGTANWSSDGEQGNAYYWVHTGGAGIILSSAAFEGGGITISISFSPGD
jgi:predicted small secreted protein